VRKYTKSDWGSNPWDYTSAIERLRETGTGTQAYTMLNDQIDWSFDDVVAGFYPVVKYKFFSDSSSPGGFRQQPARMIIKHMKLYCVLVVDKGVTTITYSDHELWATEPPLRGRCISRLYDLRQGRL
jgi:hypothetical protein